jgi:MFS transporter, SP family, sugar:H+ symporter
MPKWLELFSNGYTDADGAPALNPDDESLIVSILSAGTFLGALSAAPTADFFGRRMGLILSTAIVFNLGVILQTIATDQPLFIAGRFFAGYGVGLVSAMIPLYQSETAPKWIRGTIVGTYQLAITIGLFLASIVNNGTKDMNTTACYRIPVSSSPRRCEKPVLIEIGCSTIRLGHHLGRWHVLPSRDSSLPRQERPLRKGCDGHVSLATTAH